MTRLHRQGLIILVSLLLCAVFTGLLIRSTYAHTAETLAFGETLHEETNEIFEGNCGNELFWRYDSESAMLTIYGKGQMYDWSISDGTPWFPYQKEIKSVKVENGATTIGIYAFSGCSVLESVDLSECTTLKTINRHAFYNCPALASANLPASVTSIGDYSFYLTGIHTVNIPASTTSIGSYAFKLCPNLKEITVASNNKNYSSADGILFDKEKTKLIVCPPSAELTEYSIPSAVNIIANSAFYECRKLERVSIPKGTYRIEDYAFFGCTGMTAYSVDKSNNNYSSVDGVLFSTSDSKLMYYPMSSAVEEYSVPDGIRIVGTSSFEKAVNLLSVSLPGSLTELGGSAFAGCIKLANISFAQNTNNLTIVGGFAFAGTAISSIDLPYSIEHMGTNCFDGCTELLTATIPGNVTYLGGSTFIGCSKLVSAVLPYRITSIPSLCFSGCSQLDEVLIADQNSITSIGGRAFAECASLREYVVPSAVTSIGDYAFAGCESLETLILPETLEKLGNNSLSRCHSLAELTIPKSVISIGEYCFMDDYRLYAVDFMGIVPETFGEAPFLGTHKSFALYYDSVNASSWAPNGETQWRTWPLRVMGATRVYKGESGGCVITVLDENGSPITDASVKLGSDTRTSDVMGRVAFGMITAPAELSVSKIGYNSYVNSEFTPLAMSSVVLSDKANVLYAVSCNGVDIQSNWTLIDCSDGGTSVIRLLAYPEGSEMALVQNGAVIATSADGSFTVKNSGFVPNVPVTAYAGTGIDQSVIALNILVLDCSLGNIAWTPVTSCFAVMDENSALPGVAVELDFSGVPLDSIIIKGKLYIGMNLSSEELRSNTASLESYAKQKLANANVAGEGLSSYVCGYLVLTAGDAGFIVSESGAWVKLKLNDTDFSCHKIGGVSFDLNTELKGESTATLNLGFDTDAMMPTGSLQATLTLDAQSTMSLLPRGYYGGALGGGSAKITVNGDTLNTETPSSAVLYGRFKLAGRVLSSWAKAGDTQLELSVRGSTAYQYGADGVLASGYDPLGQAKIIKLEDGSALALYLSNDVLVCASRKSSGVWQELHTVDNSGLPCGDFDAVLSGNVVHIIYQRVQSTVAADADNSELAAAVRLYAVRYENGAFSEAVSIGDGEYCNTLPDLALVNSVPTALWAVNRENDPYHMSTANDVYLARFEEGSWGEPVLLGHALGGITELCLYKRGDEAAAALIMDANMSAEDLYDRELFLLSTDGLERIALPENTMGELMSCDNAEKLYWRSELGIRSLNTEGLAYNVLEQRDSVGIIQFVPIDSELLAYNDKNAIYVVKDGTAEVIADTDELNIMAFDLAINDREYEFLATVCEYSQSDGKLEMEAILLCSVATRQQNTNLSESPGTDTPSDDAAVSNPAISCNVINIGGESFVSASYQNGDTDEVLLFRIETGEGLMLTQKRAAVKAGELYGILFDLTLVPLGDSDCVRVKAVRLTGDETLASELLYLVKPRSAESTAALITAPTVGEYLLDTHIAADGELSVTLSENGASFSGITGLTEGRDYSVQRTDGSITALSFPHSWLNGLGVGLHRFTLSFGSYSRPLCIRLRSDATLPVGMQLGHLIYDGTPLQESCDFLLCGSTEGASYSYRAQGTQNDIEGLPTEAGSYTINVTRGGLKSEFPLVIEKLSRGMAIAEVELTDSEYVKFSVPLYGFGYEGDAIYYGISEGEDGEISWQKSPVFTGLAAGTEYSAWVRIVGSANAENATGAPCKIKTIKYETPTPPAPVLQSRSEDSVVLVGAEGYEYSMNAQDWGTSTAFTGLEPNTTYSFYQRRMETGLTYTSPASEPLYVNTLLADRDAPQAPTVKKLTSNTVELEVCEGCEYRIGNAPWQSESLFTGLAPSAEYAFSQRYAGTDTTNPSDASAEILVTTQKRIGDAPPKPIVETVGVDSVTLKVASGCVYSINGVSWQSSTSFTGLEPNHEYRFYQRRAVTNESQVSPASEYILVRTLKHVSTGSAAPGVIEVGADYVLLEAAEGCEYRCELGEWQASPRFEELCPNTGYRFSCRKAETEDAQAGAISDYTSVVTGRYAGVTPQIPRLVSKSDKSFVVLAITGCEYSIDGQTWQSGNSFSGLSPNTEYRVVVRAKATNSTLESEISEALTVVTNKSANKETLAAPELVSVGTDSVQLAAIEGAEYRVNGGSWQTSTLFEGLSPNTEYSFYCRYAETYSSYAGPVSEALLVTTTEGSVDTIAPPIADSIGHNSVKLVAVTGYEYAMDDGEWQSSNNFSGLEPNKEYGFRQRSAETLVESEALWITTDKQKQGIPETSPLLESADSSSITLVAQEGFEYRLGSDGEWQSSPVFSGLNANTSYSFYHRYVESETLAPGGTGAPANYSTIRREGAESLAPSLAAISYDSVSLTSLSGYEYRMDGGAWQSSSTFAGLAPNSTHSFTQRVTASTGTQAGQESIALNVTTNKTASGSVSAPLVSVIGYDSITLVQTNGCEYRLEQGEWQSSPLFTGLIANSTYTFYQRIAETETAEAGRVSAGQRVTTAPQPSPAAEAPKLYYVSHNSVVLVAIPNCEYRINGGAWQDSAEFTGLEVLTEYAFTARYKAKDGAAAGQESAALTVTTDKSKPAAPQAPTLSMQGEGSVTLAAINGCEYRVNGSDWQTSPLFEGLVGGVEYSFYQRYAEQQSSYASESSEGTPIAAGKTANAAGLGAPTVVELGTNYVLLAPVNGCEYSLDGVTWQASPRFDGLATNRKYSFYRRFAETDNNLAGTTSPALVVRTIWDGSPMALYGDADNNGTVNASDAAAILRYLVELAALDEQGLLNADVDGITGVSAADAACILRRLVELIDKFPVE